MIEQRMAKNMENKIETGFGKGDYVMWLLSG